RKRTRVLAETSLRQIGRLRQGADPKSYALWYSVAAGDNGSLRHAVDQLLARKRGLSRQDIDNLHDTHVSPGLASGKIEQAGSQFAEEIEEIAALIDAARGVAAAYADSLGEVTRSLGCARDHAGVRAAVDNLLHATREMETNSAGLRAQLGTALRDVAELRGALDTVRKDGLTDPLTSLGNRRLFDRSLASAIERCHAGHEPLSLLLVGIDHFERVNDVHGQLVGDRVLRFLAMTLERLVKNEDVVARYGGDEFGVVLPKSRLSTAVKLAQHMRSVVMSKDLLKHLTH